MLCDTFIQRNSVILENTVKCDNIVDLLQNSMLSHDIEVKCAVMCIAVIVLCSAMVLISYLWNNGTSCLGFFGRTCGCTWSRDSEHSYHLSAVNGNPLVGSTRVRGLQLGTISAQRA